jgi:hypothetical protein
LLANKQGDIVTKKVKQTGTAALVLIATLYSGAAAAHGKVTLEEDNCVRWVGESAVHLSAYQPQHDLTAQYCTDIPQEGETVVVIDLVDTALRDMPVGMKIIRGSGTEGETIASISPAVRPDGVLRSELVLEKGQYTVLVDAQGVPPLSYQYGLRVQMINYANTARSAIAPLIGLLIVGFLAYRFRKSQWLQNWLSSRRS